MLAYPKPLRYLKPISEMTLMSLHEVPWFTRIGTDDAIDYTRFIGDRTIAESKIVSAEWADFRLEMRNDMTAFLASRHAQNYTEWNNSAKALRSFYESEIESMIRVGIERAGLSHDVLKDVGWDIVTWLLEEAFSQYRIPRFHDRLIAIYRTGHIPCGIEPLSLDAPDGDGILQIH